MMVRNPVLPYLTVTTAHEKELVVTSSFYRRYRLRTYFSKVERCLLEVEVGLFLMPVLVAHKYILLVNRRSHNRNGTAHDLSIVFDYSFLDNRPLE